MEAIKKMQPVFYIFPIISVALGLFACSFLSNLGQPPIPEGGLVGLKAGSTRILGHFRLADWDKGVSSTLYVTLFEGVLAETGKSEVRAFINDQSNSQYIGALNEQLQLPGVLTLFFKLGDQRCLIGWVSPTVQGKLIYFRIERPQENPDLWMEAVLESSIEKNLFIVPIGASKHAENWDSLVLSAVQTKESLQRGFDGQGSYFEIEAKYSPPLDVSSFYIPILIQK